MNALVQMRNLSKVYERGAQKVDRQSATEMLTLLQQPNRDHGKTIVMVTHDPKAAEYAHLTPHLDKGSLVEAAETMA